MKGSAKLSQYPAKYPQCLNGYWINVDFCHGKMLNWLEENIISYSICPRLNGYQTMHEIFFRNEEDLFHFQIRWGEEIL